MAALVLAARAVARATAGCGAPSAACLRALAAPGSSRLLHTTAAAWRRGEEGGFEAGGGIDDEAPRRGVDDEGAPVRRGRPFLDPRAPRRQPAIRDNPLHKRWGGFIDILEHNAYCDGQREEDPDGWFFDGTKAEYDSDCDGDPFANGYLTEDELEFPEEYAVEPYVPGRIVDQIYFLYSVRGYTVKQLCTKYRLGSEKVSAILNLKKTEPQMIAAGLFTNTVDNLMMHLYEDKFRSDGTKPGDGSKPSSPRENWGPDFDTGINYDMLRDDQDPDDVRPVARDTGNVLRVGHKLPKLRPLPKKDRTHDSKFVFRDISGSKREHQPGRTMVVADYDGTIRKANNVEALYRTWGVRRWSIDQMKGDAGLPFPDADSFKPYKGDWYLNP